MELTVEHFLLILRSAKVPEQIFGTDLNSSYKTLCKTFHPDIHQNAPQYTEAFQLLNDWKARADLKAQEGTYGDGTPVSTPVDFEVTFGSDVVKLTKLVRSGDISSVYKVTVPNPDPKKQYFVKISRDPKNNDLLEREYRHLRKIYDFNHNDPMRKFLEIQTQSIPCPIASTNFKYSGGVVKRATLFKVPDGRCNTGEEFKLHKYSSGIAKEHVYWIYRQFLLTLYCCHLRGVIHGAVTPNHLLIFPEEHGVVLLDWTASCDFSTQEHVPIVNGRYRKFYPSDVFDKKPASFVTDLSMLNQSVLSLAGSDLPLEVVKFLTRKPVDKLSSSSDMYDEFGELITKLHGPRKFTKWT